MENLKSMLIIACVSASLMACNQSNSKEQTSIQTSITKPKAKQILNAYLKIKDALVNTDGEAASTSAQNLASLLDLEDQFTKTMKSDVLKIMETRDEEKQREYFNTLSENVYALVKSTSANENTIYRQYCPMAFDNQGAYWLSAEKEVNNPYFGDMMLHCGLVREEF